MNKQYSSEDRFWLALAIWREARGESQECQIGVAFSILNRVEHPKWWGNTVLNVIVKKWQYSSFTDPKDPQLTTWPTSSDASWIQCKKVASDVTAGLVGNPVIGADSYHDISIKPPKWATPEMFVKQIGKIRFFNVDKEIG